MVQKGAKRQGNYPVAKYRYFGRDTKHPYEWKTCPTCKKEDWIQKRQTYCSPRCGKLGDLNPAKQKASGHSLTKGEYVAAHQQVGHVRGKAMTCVNGCVGRRMYHWANLTGDYWDPNDYQPMCPPCHDKFDRNGRQQ